MTIEFWWRQIFEILMIHKPSLESLDGPQKIWGWSVQPFWRLLDTNKQTDKQTDKPNLYIDKRLSLNSIFLVLLLVKFILLCLTAGQSLNWFFFVEQNYAIINLNLISLKTWNTNGRKLDGIVCCESSAQSNSLARKS